MAYVIEGRFPSYFAGKPIPERPVEDKEEKKRRKKNPVTIEAEGQVIERGKPGKIFLIGTSEILTDNLIDEEGLSPNAMFVLNVLDYLNGREDYAVMRSKSQRFNPLRDTSPGTRTFIKGFNIAGLPALVILCGLFIWFRRASRRRHIQEMFRRD